MQYIQKYSGRRIKDGTTVRGYAAIGYESSTAWLMIPVKDSDNQFHSVQVDPESLVPLL